MMVAGALTKAGWSIAMSRVLGGNFSVAGIALAIRKDAPIVIRQAIQRFVIELAKNGIGSAVISEPLEDVNKAVGASFGTSVKDPDVLVLIGNK
jgi:hypothetical protein